MGEPLLTAEQVAKYLNVTVEYLEYDRSYHRRIPYIKIGKFVRYKKSDIDKHIEQNTVRGKAA